MDGPQPRQRRARDRDSGVKPAEFRKDPEGRSSPGRGKGTERRATHVETTMLFRRPLCCAGLRAAGAAVAAPAAHGAQDVLGRRAGRSQEAGARRRGQDARGRRQDDLHPRTGRGEAGEQVEVRAQNDGKVDHEFMLATVANNAKHKEEMEKNPDMEHDDPNGKRLSPGNASEIVWRFTKAAPSSSPASSPATTSRHERHRRREVKSTRKETSHAQTSCRSGMLAAVRSRSARRALRGAIAMVDGQVTKIDARRGQDHDQARTDPEARHGAMTMVFRVQDPAMLKQVKVGDKVKFRRN